MDYSEIGTKEGKDKQIELAKKIEMEGFASEENQNGEDNIKSGQSYQKAFYLAKISLELEKYEDSLRYVEEMVKLNDSEFSDEERDVFITAFRFLISDKRRAWRISYK